MLNPKSSWLILIILPLFSFFIIFLTLYYFSNIKLSTNFIYFENAQYSSQNAVSVVDNRIVYGESEGYKIQKKELENCKLNNPNLPLGMECETKFGLDSRFYKSDISSNLTKIYFYDVEKETSKIIDLESAKNLILIPERKNEAAESFESANCGGGGGLFFGGYSSYCGESNKVTIKKNYGTKTIDLETTIAFEMSKGIMPNGQKNIY